MGKTPIPSRSEAAAKLEFDWLHSEPKDCVLLYEACKGVAFARRMPLSRWIQSVEDTNVTPSADLLRNFARGKLGLSRCRTLYDWIVEHELARAAELFIKLKPAVRARRRATYEEMVLGWPSNGDEGVMWPEDFGIVAKLPEPGKK